MSIDGKVEERDEYFKEGPFMDEGCGVSPILAQAQHSQFLKLESARQVCASSKNKQETSLFSRPTRMYSESKKEGLCWIKTKPGGIFVRNKKKARGGVVHK